jgi:hypothetical protein
MAKRPSKPVPITEPAVNPPVTLTPEAFKTLMDEMASLKAALAAKPAVEPAQPGKIDQSAANAWAAKKAFVKKGYKDAEPNVNILTFNKWVALGMRPAEGQHALRVANLRLFHKSQCRPLTKAEAGEFAKKFKEAAADKRSAKVVNISPSAAKLPPVELVPQEPAKAARKAKLVPIHA